MKKLTLGKKTLRSIEIQAIAILQSIHVGKIEIRRMRPQRTDAGNYIWVIFRTSDDPNLKHSRIFAMQRVHGCCDIWLESPDETVHGQTNTSAA